MAKRDVIQNALCKHLGKEYRICIIDCERVIYRDFGNCFNVEISGMHTCNENKMANIYLWFEDGLIVQTVQNVERDAIGMVVDELFILSQSLIKKGYITRNALFEMLHSQCKHKVVTQKITKVL